MPCKLYQDFPKRVKCDEKSTVVHASREPWAGSYYDVSPCGREFAHKTQSYTTGVFLPAKSVITCKQCLAALGDRDYLKPETNRRYVVQTADGMFIKNSEGKLTENLADAMMYKVEENAVDRTKRDVWVSKDGLKKLSGQEFFDRTFTGRQVLREEGWRCKRETDPMLTVRPVKILFAGRKPTKKKARKKTR